MTDRPVRRYDVTKRKLDAETRRHEIVATAIGLMASTSDVSTRTVASAAGVSERHLYRMFGDAAGLAQSVNAAMNRVLGTNEIMDGLDAHNLRWAAVEIFRRFNGSAALVRNYLRSPLGQNLRDEWILEKRKLISLRFAGHDREKELTQVANFLLSAKMWLHLREECTMSDPEVLAFVGRIAESLCSDPEAKEDSQQNKASSSFGEISLSD